MHKKTTGALPLAAAILLTGTAAAQVDGNIELDIDGDTPIRLLRANHDDVAVHIDGHLDESVW